MTSADEEQIVEAAGVRKHVAIELFSGMNVPMEHSFYDADGQ